MKLSGLFSTVPVLAATILVSRQVQAQNQYFTSNTISGSTYSWDDPNWSVAGGTTNGPFASSWGAGDFARFYGVGAGNTITVTVNAAESMSGLYLNSGAATLNINDAGNGTGSLNVVGAASQATQNGFSWLTQGFLTAAGTVNINASITGSDGVEEESGGGNLNLDGNNSFTGGFLADSSATFIGFNNNNSFGAVASQIGFDNTTFAIMNNTGPSTVTIANAAQIIGTTGAVGVDFIGNSVNMSGNWYLGGTTGVTPVNLRNNGAAGTTVTFSGILSGTTGAVTYSGVNGGKFLLTAQNTYTGKTVVGVTGFTNITLQLGVANAIAQSTGLTLAGGTVDLGGFNQTVNGALGLTANSTISYEAGVAALNFANSSGSAWAGKINLVDWTAADAIYFGTDDTGLTSAQLADFEVNGVAEDFILNSNGELAVATPEPSAIALAALGSLGLLLRWRKK